MTGITIGNLPSDSAIGGEERIPVSDSGTTKRVTTNQIADYAVGKMVAATEALSVGDEDTVLVIQNGAVVGVAASLFLKEKVTVSADCVVGNLLGCSDGGIVLATPSCRSFAVSLEAGNNGDDVAYASTGIHDVLFEEGCFPVPSDVVYQSITVPGRATTVGGGQFIGQCTRATVNGLARVMIMFAAGVQS